ncbi:MAG: radical SAM protein [Acetanaerobacterium sp.]
MKVDRVYYEPASLDYELGQFLKEKYRDIPWVEIDSHNNIRELRENPNSEFARMKRHLIIGVRKTHKYVPNYKSSDFLVPYTSSGCGAMCLYCYLVCNYNKCAYLRVFVNREQMMDKLLKTAAGAQRELTFEIGSNSDLVLENTVTANLPWTIETFAKGGRGILTFPTKFADVDGLLNLDHRGRTLVRMSVNPQEIIRTVELGTAPLAQRIDAVNRLCAAGYRVGLLIAPIVLTEGWREQYTGLLATLADGLSAEGKKGMSIEVIFMTYSYIHRAINREAFPAAVDLYDTARMTGRGKGRYTYTAAAREEASALLRSEIGRYFGEDKILYIV